MILASIISLNLPDKFLSPDKIPVNKFTIPDLLNLIRENGL
jgi:hypothetical protein